MNFFLQILEKTLKLCKFKELERKNSKPLKHSKIEFKCKLKFVRLFECNLHGGFNELTEC